MIELEPMVERIRESAKRSCTVVVDQFSWASEAESPSHFVIPWEKALDLVELAKPQVLYLSTTILDLATLIESTVDEITDGNEDEEVTRAVQSAAKPLAKFDGRMDRVAFHFFVGSALNSAVETSDWLRQFENSVEAIVERVQAKSEISAVDSQRKALAHQDGLARKLEAEPAFSQGRTSFAKRLLLAKHMFPDESDEILSQAVQLAENLHWLKGTGFKSS